MKTITALVLVLATLTLPALAADPEAGKLAFKQCMACHMVGDNAKNRVGPILNGVVGRQAGTLGGFKYSAAMIAAGTAGLVWDEPTLTAYLAAPKAVVPGTRMAFASIKDEAERADIIAYLAMVSGERLPVATRAFRGPDAEAQVVEHQVAPAQKQRARTLSLGRPAFTKSLCGAAAFAIES